MPTYEELAHAAYLLGFVDARYGRGYKQLHKIERHFQKTYNRGYCVGAKKKALK